MTLVTRTLSNTGDPLYAPDGTLLAGKTVTFTLVSAAGRATDAWDATSHERVVGSVSIVTDAAGEFSVELWPNSRGNRVTQYLCHVDYPGVRDFIASVAPGEATLTWVQFMASGAALTAQELSDLDLAVAQVEAALGEHTADTTAAHAASAISVTAISGIAATTVQGALAELAAEKEAVDATLTAIAGVTFAADKLLYATGPDAFATTTLTEYARSLLDDTDAAAMRSTLGFDAAVRAVALTGLSLASAAAISAESTVLSALGQLQAQVTANNAAAVQLAGSYADPAWITSLAGSKITGNIAGNAATATALATPRAINGVAFDGTAAISINLNSALTAGAYLTSTGTFDGSAARTFAVDATDANTASKVVARDASGNFAAGTITASLTGTASNASQLLNATWAAPAAIGSGAPAAGTFTTLQATGNLTVDGDLLVSGNTVTVNTSTISVEDPLVKYASANVTDAVDIGFYALYQPVATPLYTGLFRDATDGKYKLFSGLEVEPTTTVNTAGAGYAVATLVASLEGNAATATALQTARAINGVDFDGTQAITVTAAAGTLTGTTLAANVVNASLNAITPTGGTLAITGALSATGAISGSALLVQGGGTSSRFVEFTNTGVDFYVGIEGSTGGGFFTGSSAYASVLYSPGSPIEMIINGTNRATISSTGLAVTGALSSTDAAGGRLTLTGQAAGNYVQAQFIRSDSTGFRWTTPGADSFSLQHTTDAFSANAVDLITVSNAGAVAVTGTVSAAGATMTGAVGVSVNNAGAQVSLHRPGGATYGPSGGATFDATNSAAAQVTLAQVFGYSTSLTAGAEDGQLHVYTKNAGALGLTAAFSSTGLAVTGAVISSGLITGNAIQSALFNNAAGTYATWQHNGSSIGDIGTGNQITGGGATTDFAIDVRGANTLHLCTAEVSRVAISATGVAVTGALSATGTASFGATGTLDKLSIAGQAAGSGASIFATTYDAGAYAPLTIDSSIFVWRANAGTTVFSATGSGLAVTGALSTTSWIGLDANAKYIPDDGVVGGALYTAGHFRVFTAGTEVTRTNYTGFAVRHDLATSTFIADDGLGQLLIKGATNDGKRLAMGYNTTANEGVIQAQIIGVGGSPLALNPSGGLVTAGAGLAVTGLTTTDTLRINVAPTAETPPATHTVPVNVNGTAYKFLALAA
jgi:hypothetical protein